MNEYKDKQETSENLNQSAGKTFKGRRSWVILLFVVIAAVVLVLSLASKRIKSSISSDNRPSTFTARTDDLIITVTEGGSIKARKTIEVKCEVDERQMTILDVVPEGTTITEEDFENGKVLVTLESSTIKDQLTQREMDFASAEASYTQAKEANDIQVNQNASSIAQAELRVKFALIDLKKYLGEPVAEKLLKDINPAPNPNIDLPSMLEEAQLGGDALKNMKNYNNNITLAEGRSKQSSNQLDWTRKLREKEYVSQTELEQHELNAQSNELQQQQAKIELELYKLYTFPKDVAQKLSDYEEANRSLERTYAECRARLAQKVADCKKSESNFRSRKERLEKSRKDLELCVIKAPAPGLVIYGLGSDDHRRYRGMGIIGPGETVYRNQTLITLPDLTKLMVDISVHESSVDKVKPGQRAKIVLDAFPDTTLTGEVLKVAPLPDQSKGWFNPDLKVYKTEVAIDGAHDFVKPGMSAKAEILVNHIKDALIVPNHVVSNRLGKKVCYVSTSSGSEQREVQTGQYNDAFVQILSGLQAGEKVLLNPPTLTETEAGAANGFEEEIKIQASTEAEEETTQQSPARQEHRQGRQFDPEQMELTDERIDGIMGMLSQADAKKAEELKKLRESDPEKFKTELRKVIAEQMQKMRQGRGGDSRQGGGEGSDNTRRRGGGEGMGRRGGGGERQPAGN
ncbi:MAG: efflux RND transporter periplasmic adaptor subunit [Planctomycetota bacterium]|jgi:multidrug resistance efflux pump